MRAGGSSDKLTKVILDGLEVASSYGESVCTGYSERCRGRFFYEFLDFFSLQG